MNNQGLDIPLELNWVKARAECSLVRVFKALELAVKEDVDAINSLLKPGSGMSFAVANYGKRFSAVCEVNHYPSNSVDFILEEDGIQIGESGNIKFRATLTLTNSGRCKLKVNGEELEQWQVRRKALEDLFFDKNRGQSL
jgi:hypothetical protein